MFAGTDAVGNYRGISGERNPGILYLAGELDEMMVIRTSRFPGRSPWYRAHRTGTWRATGNAGATCDLRRRGRRASRRRPRGPRNRRWRKFPGKTPEGGQCRE